MTCTDCGGDYAKRAGTLTVQDLFVGPYKVEGVTYFECPRCRERLLPPATIRSIEGKRRQILDRWLHNQPLGNFVSAPDAARLLKVTRQALHKSRRFAAGLVYWAEMEGRRFYYRPSLLAYLRTGDGRLQLHHWIEASMPVEKLYMATTSRGPVPGRWGAMERAQQAAMKPPPAEAEAILQPVYSGSGRSTEAN